MTAFHLHGCNGDEDFFRQKSCRIFPSCSFLLLSPNVFFEIAIGLKTLYQQFLAARQPMNRTRTTLLSLDSAISSVSSGCWESSTTVTAISPRLLFSMF